MKTELLHSRKVWVIRRTRDFRYEYWLSPGDFLLEDVEHATEYSVREDAEQERRTLRDNPDANLTESDRTEVVPIRVTVEEIAEVHHERETLSSGRA